MGQQLEQLYIDDPEGFQEFRQALADYSPRIEALLTELAHAPGDQERIADLFRLFHNIKGDAALCRVEFIPPFVHAIETLLMRLRSGEIQYSE
ncbi:MAG: Hpt domain-containing protein, partial [Burkholderiaceae bacterium]|nr:Hpt domain-containing protein [Burkholderiaceae bacterium]